MMRKTAIIGLALFLLLAMALTSRGAEAATFTNSDTRTIASGGHDVIMFFEAQEGAQVIFTFTVELGTNIDLLIMDEPNYFAYEAGGSFSYLTGSLLDRPTGTGTVDISAAGERYYVVLDNSDAPPSGVDPTGSVTVFHSVTATNVTIPSEIFDFLFVLAIGAVIVVVLFVVLMYLIFFRKKSAPPASQQLNKACPRCGYQVPSGFQYCPKCGHKW